MSKFVLADLTVTPFHGCDEKLRTAFETFVKGLTLDRDNEPGDDPEKGTWVWVNENEAALRPGQPYSTFIFQERTSGEIVATASFVQDDRATAAKLGVDKDRRYFGIWGFFLARHDLRRLGLGTIIAKYVDDYVQAQVDDGKTERLVYLFTSVPHAMKMYERLGFVRQDQSVNLPEFGFDETLFKKTYSPRGNGFGGASGIFKNLLRLVRRFFMPAG
ncbi:MAG TPA: GNAT family N-acetyltransferase [Planktothrix sp.]|jgi:GNAT superfamily N-acetyltransferase